MPYFQFFKQIIRKVYNKCLKIVNIVVKKLTPRPYTLWQNKKKFVASFTSLVPNGMSLLPEKYTKPEIYQIGSYEEYIKNREEMKQTLQCRKEVEIQLAKPQRNFSIEGYNPMLDEMVRYSVNFDYSGETHNGLKLPNYRESLLCPVTHTNSRIRATYLIIDKIIKAKGKNISIYMTEQVTAFFHYYQQGGYKEVVGSEFLGDECKSGQQINGITHQDITKLSYPDNRFDIIVTLEVLEHVPDYRAAYRELFRCLKKGGVAVISVPFSLTSENNSIRAVISDGGIKHLLEPEYHGDPVNPEGGILCFQHFGWEMLNELRDVGFTDVKANFTWNIYNGIIGNEIMILTAVK